MTDSVPPAKPPESPAPEGQLPSVAARLDLFQRAGGLAHGQRRLLELGMALAGRPRLLLLDEPAAGLTPADHGHLLTALRGLPTDVAVLLVDHHLSIVTALGATVTVLRDGRTVLTGRVDEILTDPAFRDAYLRTATVVT